MLNADASSLKALGRALRASDAAMYRAVQAALRAEGRKVAERAKRNASWSTRIPATVRTRAAGLNAVVVSAGGPGAPHAKPLEHAGAPGEFRHPVFGDRQMWVDQDARPFLHPAALQHLQESAEALAEALTVQVEKTIHGQEVYV